MAIEAQVSQQYTNTVNAAESEFLTWEFHFEIKQLESLKFRFENSKLDSLEFQMETFITRFGTSPAPHPRAEIDKGGQKLLWPQF